MEEGEDDTVEFYYRENWLDCPNCGESLDDMLEQISVALNIFSGKRWPPTDDVPDEMLEEYTRQVEIYIELTGAIREQLKCPPGSERWEFLEQDIRDALDERRQLIQDSDYMDSQRT